MANWADLRTRSLSAIIFGALVLFINGWSEISFIALLLLAGIVLLREWVALTRNRPGAWIVFGMVYLWASLGALAFLRDISCWLVYALLLLVWAGDIGAYFVGKQFGRHKLAPDISPGKTWEGLFGGILFTTIAVAALTSIRLPGVTLFAPSFYALATFFPVSLEHPQWVVAPWLLNSFLFGTLVALIGLAGDLAESSLKRKAGVKDSGNIMPGHGGLFDRLDALLPNAIFFALVMLWVESLNTWP